METQIASRRDEESLEEISFRQSVNVSGNINCSTSHRNGSSKAKDSVKVKSSNLCVVTFIVSEVEMVGKSFLASWKPHGLEQCLTAVIKGYDQLQLGSSFLLLNTDNRKTSHLIKNRLNVGGLLIVHFPLGDAELELLPDS